MKKISTALLALILSLPIAANAAPLAGMPPVLDANNIYAADAPNNLSDVVKGVRELVYVPNYRSGTVSVIDPKTYKIIKTLKTKAGPQHIVPSWDLKTLWINNNAANYLTPIDPKTVTTGTAIYAHDPYNLYFTPNGKYALTMAELDREIVFRDTQTMAIKNVLKVPCPGLNHADWTADGNQFVATCEFSSKLILVDTANMKLLKVAVLPKQTEMNPMPQDVKISPDGKTFYIADMASNGVWIMPANNFGHLTFMRTGKGTHGLYVTRDAKTLLITNRGEGSVSVLRFSDNKLIARWKIPGGGSPDMGNISADGKFFWVSGRYDDEVYVFNIEKGEFVTRIKVGQEPHGLTIWPQPGRYSLGHTGILR